MNRRSRFDVLVAPARVGSVIEAQQQAFAMPRKELNMRNHLVRERLAIPSFFEIKESDGVPKLSEKNRISFFRSPR